MAPVLKEHEKGKGDGEEDRGAQGVGGVAQHSVLKEGGADFGGVISATKIHPSGLLGRGRLRSKKTYFLNSIFYDQLDGKRVKAISLIYVCVWSPLLTGEFSRSTDFHPSSSYT